LTAAKQQRTLGVCHAVVDILPAAGTKALLKVTAQRRPLGSHFS
jgi:hypothetical protein